MPGPTLLEAAFPFAEVSQLIEADRRSPDPAYGIHRWWARRPPALMRALLLAATTPASSGEAFWQTYRGDSTPLAGLRVLDPFVGGGSTLVEAARLGADVCGGDIDPLAVRIVRRELAPADPTVVQEVGNRLLAELSSRFESLYPSVTGSALHYFSLAEVTCPSCDHSDLLYRNLIIARDAGKPGGVVRDAKLSAFCPDCRKLHNLASSDRSRLHCCGRYHELIVGTFSGQQFTCRRCGTRATHRELRTGIAPRELIAVEETRSGGRRCIRPPNQDDVAAQRRASRLLQEEPPSAAPAGPVPSGRKDGRPQSFGVTDFREAFSDRQLLVLGGALDWLDEHGVEEAVADSLILAISNALATNNRLCGYATEYGRLAPLFSVRGYSLPVLAVELNPLHPTAGRGTLAACIRRVAKAGTEEVRRSVWDTSRGRPAPQWFRFDSTPRKCDVQERSAEVAQDAEPDIDLCIFDPPYFDYISYDELADFHRAWLPASAVAGEPLLPSGEDPASGFGLRLGTCLQSICQRLRGDTPLAFTYHASSDEAWQAIGIALDEAKLAVTALWPVRSDGHMGHHSHAGNCEWDIVVVARPISGTQPAGFLNTVEDWIRSAAPLHVSDADRASMSLAIDMATARFAAVRSIHEAGE